MQDGLLPNLGICRHMKPTDVSWNSIPGKAYGLRDVDAKTRICLVMSFQRHEQISCFINVIFQKYEPKQKLNFQVFWKPFCHLFLCGVLYKRPPFDMKLVWPLIVDCLGCNESPTSFFSSSYFSTYSEIWSPPNCPLQCFVRQTILLKWIVIWILE